VTPSQALSRSPEASSKGTDEACANVPAAWLAMQIRAVAEIRKIGFG